VAERLLQEHEWYLLRELLQSHPKIDAHIETLSQPGALTAGLNWYRANLPPERLLGTGVRLPLVQAPTLGLFGAQDAYLTESAMLASESMVAAPWRFERFADAGHWLMLEEPERFNALLLDFLASNG
jgi:pimeloyl-ACP methyl ester carboxylesterase